ncbi:MAG TPA: hypothetical protein VGI19_04075 [Candidatus Cybelea sp.]|jgi:uncharacterized membrane protein
MPLLAAALLGFLAGLRTFTAPAVLWLMRRGTPLAYVLGVLALLEYVADLSPRTPARTQPFGLIARACSGAFCGWAVTSQSGAPVVAGVLLGALAAVGGAYAGLAARTAAIERIGRVPAALLEDAVAIVASVAVVTYV